MATPMAEGEKPVFDLDTLRIRHAQAPKEVRGSGRLPKVDRRDGYFGGNIPMRWFNRAACLPGKALALSVLIWHWATLEKRRATIAVRPGDVRAAGISRNAMYHALTTLEHDGLVKVDRRRGRAAVVQILDVKLCELAQ